MLDSIQLEGENSHQVSRFQAIIKKCFKLTDTLKKKEAGNGLSQQKDFKVSRKRYIRTWKTLHPNFETLYPNFENEQKSGLFRVN